MAESDKSLDGKKIAVLSADGFQQSELTEPIKALRDAGAEVHIVSPNKDKVRGWDAGNWADSFDVDVALDQAKASDYDGVVVPGGVQNPDKLRGNEAAVQFIRDIHEAGKPVAAICHGPWPLIDAGVVKGRKVTSYKTLKTDLVNAGAEWVDEEVVVDGPVVTSRLPKDLPAFNAKIVEVFAKGGESGERAA